MEENILSLLLGDSRNLPLLSCLVFGSFRIPQEQVSVGLQVIHCFPHKVLLDSSSQELGYVKEAVTLDVAVLAVKPMENSEFRMKCLLVRTSHFIG